MANKNGYGQAYFEEQFHINNQLLPLYKQLHNIIIKDVDFIKSSNGKIKRIKENYSL